MRSTPGAMATAPAVKPAPRPMTSTRRGCARQKVGEVREHALQPHVFALARRLHFSCGVVDRRAARRPRHGDERVQTFAGIFNLRQAVPRRRVPAVGDEHARHRRQPPGEEHGAGDGKKQPPAARETRRGRAARYAARAERRPTSADSRIMTAAARAGCRSATPGRPRRAAPAIAPAVFAA